MHNRSTISKSSLILSGMFLLITFSSCDQSGETNLTYPVKIIMHTNQEINHLDSSQNGAIDIEAERLRQRPDISIDPKESVIHVQNINLDTDSHEEQVIAVKDLSNPASPIRIITADFDSLRNSYVRSWETDTNAVNLRTFRLDFQDVNGDRRLEIIASGINADGNVSLDIFQIQSFFSFQLSYFPICRLISDGTIDIIDNTPSESGAEYEYSRSFPIVLFKSNPETDEYTDTIKETYVFSPGSARYELSSIDRISQREDGESQLEVLFQSKSEELFSDFIKGIWFRVDEEGNSLPEIVSFDPIRKEIIFFSDNVQEIYYWKYSRRSLYNVLTIYSENAMLQSIKPNFTISISSLSGLNVLITDNHAGEQWIHEQWGGKYIRSKELTDQLEGKLRPPKIIKNSNLVDGTWINGSDETLRFSYPHFTWEKNSIIKKGGFAILNFTPSPEIEQTVLSLKIIEDNALTIEEKVYLLEYKKTADETTIIMKPATTNVYRVEESRGAPLTFIRSDTVSP